MIVARAKTVARGMIVDQEKTVVREKTVDQEKTVVRAKTVAQETTVARGMIVVRAKNDPEETAGSPENRGNRENPANRASKNPYLNLRGSYRPKAWSKSCQRDLDSCAQATTTT